MPDDPLRTPLGTVQVVGLGTDGFLHRLNTDTLGNLQVATVSSATQTLAYNAASSTSGTGQTTSLLAVPGKTNFITGFDLTLGPAATGATGILTVGNAQLATAIPYQIYTQPTFGLQLIVRYPQGIPATAQNTAISVVLPAIVNLGASAIAVYGYTQ